MENPNTWNAIQHCIADHLVGYNPDERAQSVVRGLIAQNFLNPDYQEQAQKIVLDEIADFFSPARERICGYSLPTSIYHKLSDLLAKSEQG